MLFLQDVYCVAWFVAACCVDIRINAFPIGSCVFINIHLRALKFANSFTYRVIYVAL